MEERITNRDRGRKPFMRIPPKTVLFPFSALLEFCQISLQIFK